MAIFGTSAPKWVYDYGGSNEHTILFDYAYDENFKPKTTYIEHESEIDLERDYILKGSHYILNFKLNLFKYTDPPAKYDEINDYKGLKGVLWRHRDGNPLKKADGSNALFTLKDIIPFYRENVTYKDALSITFESCSPVDLSLISAYITQSPDRTAIEGDTVTYTCSTDASNPTYQWYKDGVAVGTSSNTYVLTTALSDDGSKIKCNVSDGTNSNDSNILTLKIDALVLSIAQDPEQYVDENNVVTYTCTTNVSDPVYSWYKDGSIVGTNSSTYSFTATAADDGAVITCQVSDGLYGHDYGSDSLTLTVMYSVSITQDPANPVVEDGTVTYTCTTTAVNPTYQWYKDDVAVGTNSNTYAFATVIGDDNSQIWCTVGDGYSFITSSKLTLEVTAFTVSIDQVPANPVDENTVVTYTCTTNALTPTYQWYKDAVAVGTNSATYAPTVATGDNGSVIKCNVDNGVNNKDSNSLTLYVQSLSAWKLVGYGGGGYFRTSRFGTDENNIILGGDRCSVYASSNKGASWQDGGAGILHSRVEQIAVHPTTRSTMICATMGGVFRSTDNGNTWTNIFTNVFTATRQTTNSLGYISAVAYNKANPDIMYAATGGYHAQATTVNPFRFYKSVNGGNTWVTLSSGNGGLATGGDSAFVIDTAENDANTVYLATKYNLYKSNNAGDSFTNLNVPDGAIFVMVKPVDSSVVYYGKYGDYYTPENYPRNLYQSVDGGSTWTNLTNGIDATDSYAVEMHYDPVYKTELYLAISNGTTTLGNQIYKSTNGGTSWAAIGFNTAPSNASNSGLTPKTFDIYNGNLVFTRGVTMFTSDAHTLIAPDSSKWTGLDADVVTVGGESYFRGRGNEFLDLFRVDVHPTNHDIMFAAVADWRLVKSADGGSSWKRLTVEKPLTHDGTSLGSAGDVAFCTTNDDIAFLSCYDQGGGASSDVGVLLRTSNANATTPTWTKLTDTSGLPYAPSGHDSRRLWEVVSNDRGDMFTCAYGAIYRSLYDSNNPNDVGLSWSQVGTAYGNQGHFAIAPSDNSIMYYTMAAANTAGIWKSTNYGASWTQLSYTTTDMLHTTGLAVDPTDPDIVWATQTSYLNYNQGYGGLWKIDTSAQIVHQQFAQTADSDGVPITYANSYGVAIDPSNKNNMIMATHDASQLSGDYANVWKGQGIWYSTDAGTTWNYLSGVGHNSALGISLDKYNRKVYIGVDQRSAYQIDFTKL